MVRTPPRTPNGGQAEPTHQSRSIKWKRQGHGPEDIGAYDPALFPYIQLSDGPASIDLTDHEACLYDAREGRLAPGEGELPLREMLRFIDPTLPIGVEVLSRAYNERYPDARERAQVILERTKRFLRGADTVR